MKNTYPSFIIILLIVGCFSPNLKAQFPPSFCGAQSLSAYEELDINNVKARFYADGNMWYNEDRQYYEVPKGSGIFPFLNFDLWMAGIDEYGQKRYDVEKYNSWYTYYSGPLNEQGVTSYETCNNFDRVWKINKSDLEAFRAGELEEIPKDILEWPARGNPPNLFEVERDLAPFVDVNGDGIYNPLEGDYPEILGDQALWWVFNDQGGRLEYLNYLPMQVDVQVMAYAYNSDEALQNHTFYKYTFTNRSGTRLDSVMMGMFIDVDLGQFDDDYVGYDASRNLAIGYNGDANDGDYGLDIPMAGIKLLQGPQKQDGGYSDFYTFWFRQGGFTVLDFPETLSGMWLGMLGRLTQDRPITYGGRGVNPDNPPTRYMYPSDPSDEEGWSECTAERSSGDRTMFMSLGPFTMQPNEQKELHFAALWVRDSIPHPCPSFAPIQEAADYVQDLFDKGIITNIEENISSNAVSAQIRLFPNPINSHSSLQLEQTSNVLQQGELKLYDSLGRLVQSATLEEKRVNELEVAGLVSGVYFYQLEWERGGVESGKLVVQ